MKTNSETIKSILSNLASNNQETVLSSLETIRENGSAEIIIPLLELALDNKNEVIKNTIFSVLSDLKTSDATPILSNAIIDNKYITIKKELLSICWQSGLNFSENFEKLFPILTNSSYEAMIEGYTLFSETLQYLNENQKSNLIIYINENINKLSTDKQKILKLILDEIRIE
jgi:hypothetical protein